jgi:hypothetical protein
MKMTKLFYAGTIHVEGIVVGLGNPITFWILHFGNNIGHA